MVSLDGPIRASFSRVYVAFVVGIALVIGAGYYSQNLWYDISSSQDLSDICHQPELITPNGKFKDSSFVFEEYYIQKSINLLAGAVRIPTVSFDDMNENVEREPRYEVFKSLHSYLFHNFPLAYRYHQVVNDYGLLYIIEGTDSNLEPIILLAHQDVVPVDPDTEDQWDHAPFSGEYDGEFLHGRGVSDSKNILIGLLEAVEVLLRQHWKPERTVILSFGFDEELSGRRGAENLAKELGTRFKNQSMAVIIDEGTGVSPIMGADFAKVAVSEKGKVEYSVRLTVAGGHPSVPPEHTSIGILSELVTVLEKHTFQPSLEEGNAFIETLGCAGKYSPRLDSRTRDIFTGLDSKANRDIAVKMFSSDPTTSYLLRTSQAIDVFKAGVKINSLPETAIIAIENLIDVDSSIDVVTKSLVGLAKELSSTYDLGLYYDGELVQNGSYGVLNITQLNGFEPSAISKSSGEMWDIIGGTTKHIFQDIIPDKIDNLYMTPMILPSTTGSTHYRYLSDHIYRYSPIFDADSIKHHTVNERLRFRSHLVAVAWYYEFLINSSM